MEEMRQQLRVDSRPNSVLEHVEKSVLHLGMNTQITERGHFNSEHDCDEQFFWKK